jgi:hypothetical protein
VNAAGPANPYVVLAFILVGFLFALTGCSGSRLAATAGSTKGHSAPVTEPTPSSDRVEFPDTPDMDPYYAVGSLSELESKAAVIVRVRMLEHRQVPESEQQPVTGPPLGYTVSTVLVEKVYKSDGLI